MQNCHAARVLERDANLRGVVVAAHLNAEEDEGLRT
jgi:hypothetical protein